MADAVGALRKGLDPLHGTLGVVGISPGGVGTCDCGFLRAGGGAFEPLADGEVVFLCPPGREFVSTFPGDFIRDPGFCQPVEPLARFSDPHFLIHVLGGSDKFITG